MATREALSWSLKRKTSLGLGALASLANLRGPARSGKVRSGRSGTGTVEFRFRNFYHPLNPKIINQERPIDLYSQGELRPNRLRTDLGIRPA